MLSGINAFRFGKEIADRSHFGPIVGLASLCPCNPANRVNPVRTPIAMQKLIECVPNFSEGRDPDIIRQITDAIASVDGVSLLDVDPGATTNRTVVTFVGSPEAAVEMAAPAMKLK